VSTAVALTVVVKQTMRKLYYTIHPEVGSRSKYPSLSSSKPQIRR
jgi:hypothetical protein